jgi:glycyl-tRNA synthetase (class II)
VTLRDRDTLKQDRLKMQEVTAEIRRRLQP